MKEFIL